MRKNIVALILEKDNLLLVEKRKETKSSDPGKFVFPGGHVHDNESLDEAINREAFEELNIKLIEPKLVYVADFNGPEEEQKIHWYWCNKFEGVMQNNEAEELIWIKPSESDKLTYQVSRDAINALLKQK
ncbi:MAG: NUDIX domain-containing protein [Patescibacteria group bacterium]